MHFYAHVTDSERPGATSDFDVDHFDESFLWNAYMINPLVKFRSQLVSHEREALDASRILTSAIRGFVFTNTIPISSAPIPTNKAAGLPASLTLISRLSCRRAGTRFNSRGIDDDGNVSFIYPLHFHTIKYILDNAHDDGHKTPWITYFPRLPRSHANTIL
jgi:hypothetical protein